MILHTLEERSKKYNRFDTHANYKVHRQGNIVLVGIACMNRVLYASIKAY